MNETTFTIKGFALSQRRAWIHDDKNSAVYVPRNWEGKNVVCILTEEVPVEE